MFEAKRRREQMLLVTGRRLIDLMNRRTWRRWKRCSETTLVPMRRLDCAERRHYSSYTTWGSSRWWKNSSNWKQIWVQYIMKVCVMQGMICLIFSLSSKIWIQNFFIFAEWNLCFKKFHPKGMNLNLWLSFNKLFLNSVTFFQVHVSRPLTAEFRLTRLTSQVTIVIHSIQEWLQNIFILNIDIKWTPIHWNLCPQVAEKCLTSQVRIIIHNATLQDFFG